jgi:hypothetical protein
MFSSNTDRLLEADVPAPHVRSFLPLVITTLEE